MSAGELYDKIGKKAKAKIVYAISCGAICKIIEETLVACGEIPSPKIDEEVNEIKFGTKYEEEE